MESLLLPSKIRFTRGERPTQGVLVAEPFAQGYGTTVGNALRRVLLSSLPGAAITSVKIKGVEHEFSAIPHVKEDVLEVILNLKAIRLKSFSAEPVKLSLSVKGEKAVTAADFRANADVEIVNPEALIATLTDKGATLEMEVTIEQGRGYRTTDDRSKEKLELGTIAIDALYSPVLNVSYKVEATRLGDRTDYDKLVLSIETDGTVDPLDAAKSAVEILSDHLSLLKEMTYET
jgi:DNA-directed RNA polymerase subunit alpha